MTETRRDILGTVISALEQKIGNTSISYAVPVMFFASSIVGGWEAVREDGFTIFDIASSFIYALPVSYLVASRTSDMRKSVYAGAIVFAGSTFGQGLTELTQYLF